ncbi:hypothetical protein DSUL_20394 [Desulfovibrionales bacterium]
MIIQAWLTIKNFNELDSNFFFLPTFDLILIDAFKNFGSPIFPDRYK